MLQFGEYFIMSFFMWTAVLLKLPFLVSEVIYVDCSVIKITFLVSEEIYVDCSGIKITFFCI